MNKLIDAKVVPALTKRDQEFEKFSESIFGTRKECVVTRIGKCEVDIAVTRDSLDQERRERKQRHGELGARVLRCETQISEKADQSEVDALLRSVIKTMGNVGQRMGENEAQVATTKVAQQQMEKHIGTMQNEIINLNADLTGKLGDLSNRQQTDTINLDAEMKDLTNRQLQLETKVETWKADGGQCTLAAPFHRVRLCA